MRGLQFDGKVTLGTFTINGTRSWRLSWYLNDEISYTLYVRQFNPSSPDFEFTTLGGDYDDEVRLLAKDVFESWREMAEANDDLDGFYAKNQVASPVQLEIRDELIARWRAIQMIARCSGC